MKALAGNEVGEADAGVNMANHGAIADQKRHGDMDVERNSAGVNVNHGNGNDPGASADQKKDGNIDIERKITIPKHDAGPRPRPRPPIVITYARRSRLAKLSVKGLPENVLENKVAPEVPLSQSEKLKIEVKELTLN